MRTYGEPIDVRTARPDVDVLSARPALAPRSRPVLPGAAAPSLPATRLSPTVPLNAGAPEQFLWRGRLYLVRDVLAHWVELGSWWSVRGGAGRPGPRPTSRAGGADRPGRPAEGSGDAAPRSVAVDVGAVEREVWRVEAAPGRGAAHGVYDLVRDVPAHDPVTGLPPGGPSRWRLARALD